MQRVAFTILTKINCVGISQMYTSTQTQIILFLGCSSDIIKCARIIILSDMKTHTSHSFTILRIDNGDLGAMLLQRCIVNKELENTNHFFKFDNSLNIIYKHFKFGLIILDVTTKGTISQIFYLGPSSFFM